MDFLKSKEEKCDNNIETHQIKKNYIVDSDTHETHNKFSNQEKSIIKRFRNSTI